MPPRRRALCDGWAGDGMGMEPLSGGAEEPGRHRGSEDAPMGAADPRLGGARRHTGAAWRGSLSRALA
ncbi:hypothetical protein NDU88_009917 [Pleurodeles waltl]|uniref:Uncharacterized protein n=1 Tax=Pleurodeles waltl TaxID=8319 RepID=A0AAV7RZN1_PLEWA|nr:hypothetical protein NDU88_009917 [Pleurodeles waltl]